MKTKTCIQCGIEKDVSEFYKASSHKDGLSSQCKQCRQTYIQEYNIKNKKSISANKKKYYQTHKDEQSTRSKKYYKENKEKILKRVKEDYKENRESILEYQKEYNKNNRSKIKDKNVNYYEDNKFEIRRKSKIYRASHKKEELVRSKKYRDTHKQERKEYLKNNKEKLKLQAKEYKPTHKKEILNYRRKRQQYKMKNDPNYKILITLRSRINKALKDNSKSESTKQLLGCSIDFLKNHLAKQFVKGMTWKNHSRKGWHIDHIKPCELFDLSKPSEQKKCFNYINLQPLWAKDNLQKGIRFSSK